MRVGRVGRDGLRSAREARGARRADPRCHVQSLALAPVETARACIRKSATRSSPSWRPAGCRRSSCGGPWRPKRRSRGKECGNASPLSGSMCSSCGAQSASAGSASRIGSLSVRILGLGGDVRKGEHGTTVLYADHFVPDEERKRAVRDGDEPSALRFLKRFTVFNTDQCKDLPREVAPSPVPKGLMVPQAEALIAATGADFRIGGYRVFYSPNYDFIQVPRPEAHFPSTGTGRSCTSSVSGRARRKDSIVISPAASDRRSMPTRSWSPRSPAPSCVLRSASCQRCATPTILAPGSRSCARMIALSFAPPAPRRRR